MRRPAHSGALLAGRFGNIALYYYGPEVLEHGQTLPRVVPESSPEPFVGLRYRDHRGERHLRLARFRAETAEAVWGQRVTVTGAPRGWEWVPLEWIEERCPVRWDAEYGVLCRADRWPER